MQDTLTKVTLEVLRTAELMLQEVRQDYLRDSGWAEDKPGRWHRDFPWGRESIRRVEADLVDAVGYQAKYDERT